MIDQPQTVNECPVCARVTPASQCPRCDWTIVGPIILGSLDPFDKKLESAKKHWNLRAAVLAAGTGAPAGNRIQRYCQLAGIECNTAGFWETEIQPLLPEPAAYAPGNVSFENTLRASTDALDAETGQSFCIVELSKDGVAQCRVSKSPWGTIRRTDPDITDWQSIITNAPPMSDELRFFLAGGRLASYPSGQTIIGCLDVWLQQSASACLSCTSIVVWNRLPDWSIPGLLIERMGKRA